MSKKLVKTRKAEQAEGRPRKRTPLSVRNILKWHDQEEGYVYRFVNNVEDRVARFKEAGYVPVESKDPVGDQRDAGDASPIGSQVEKSVGGGTKAILMRIKEEWYKEDQKEKQANVDEIERSMDPRVREKQLRESGRLDSSHDRGGWEGGIHISR